MEGLVKNIFIVANILAYILCIVINALASTGNLGGKS